MADKKHSVLLTGGNGFIASHVLAQLLEVGLPNACISVLTTLQQGYNVTATVRSEGKAHQLLAINPIWKDEVHFQVVPELTAPDAFDKVFDNAFDFIVHTASPVAFSVNDIQKDLIDPAVEG